MKESNMTTEVYPNRDEEPDNGLFRAAASALGLRPKEPTDRDMSMIGYSEETKRAILRAIEVNPTMEATFLHIAELAYLDGETSV